MQALVHGHGAVQTLQCAGLTVNALPASALEAGPANLWLRCWEDDGRITPVPLLGPAAPGRAVQRAGRRWHHGQWRGLHYRVMLRLAKAADAWFWHVALHNQGEAALRLDLVLVQDLALTPWATVRLNEAYVSQYLDHHPLQHRAHGWAIATRQNAAVLGRHPWLLSGSLGHAVAYATDGLQLLGRGGTGGAGLLDQPLPSSPLQHEHGLAALQEQAFVLAPGQSIRRGFFGWLLADHAAASGPDDLAQLDLALALPEASAPEFDALDAQAEQVGCGDDPRNLFSSAPHWPAQTPTQARLEAWFEPPWRHLEVDAQGQLLSFFRAEQAHVITGDQARRMLRPPGHILRSGRHATPDESAVASTVWMAGVFHSSLTQGHASANRCLTTQRGYLGQFRALGLRLFVDAGAGWRLLDLPSAFAMTPDQASWRYADGLHDLELVATAGDHDPSVSLSLQVHAGPPLAVLVSLHLALGSADSSDDGLSEASLPWLRVDGPQPSPAAGSTGSHVRWQLPATAGSDLALRFGAGGLALACDSDAATLGLLGDEALFLDGRSRRLPYHCIRLSPLRSLSLTLTCTLVPPGPQLALTWQPTGDALTTPLRWKLPATAAGAALGPLADWLPWLQHNAMVHYLSPRGLEQYSGGGWGTRDVCQGPAELLLALGRHDVLRDLLCRVFSAQNIDGDWPQWFMFYPRDADMRADDAHGDIVFWPLVALSDYLLASGDASLLDQPLPFYGQDQTWPLTEHVQRALAVIQQRRIAGTELAAYGHGDWNDALQPADPAMREQLCSAWTVTLHHRMLRGLAAAWRQLGHSHQAQGFANQANAVLADFQRLLVVDGVVAGYASFDRAPRVDYLLHPRDARTGIHYSALPMVHAILDELFTPEQAAAHATLIESELTGPDGLRLFDAPLRYAGGPITLFQRGESASYFGREIGLMYMHAHLRWAEALARLGRAEALLRALQLANPIALQALVPQAAPRQRNCFYSSSDAGFATREQASRDYHRLAEGGVALEGGWRIYSSGAGIAYRLVVQQLLGLQQRHDQLGIDPVLPAGPQGLDGLEVQIELYGQPVAVRYQVGQLGHGPLAVRLNGVALALVPGSNRYRRPGVWVDNAALKRPPDGDHHQLEITLA